VVRYYLFPAFRWQEEKPAWRAQIKKMIENDVRLSPALIAYILSTQYWGMVDKQTARRWLESL